jgi:hypothetical protein
MYKWDPKENPCSMDGDLDGNASLFTPHPIRQLKPADHVRDSIESHLAHVQQVNVIWGLQGRVLLPADSC